MRTPRILSRWKSVGTSGGKRVTERDIDRMVREAEVGYDPTELLRRRREREAEAGATDIDERVPDEDDERLAALYDTRVREHDNTHPGYAAAWREFAEILLVVGGRHVVPPLDPDPMIGMLTDRGSMFEPPAIVTKLGVQSDCHRNAVGLWRAGEAVAIGTGFGLSEDSLWREHSWAIAANGCFIETTEQRTAYFGIEMRDDLAEWFADWIEGDV